MSVRKYRSLWRCLPLKLCSGIIVYIILLASCMIFTQALRSPVSAIACIFILSLPVADIICFILSAVRRRNRFREQLCNKQKGKAELFSYPFKPRFPSCFVHGNIPYSSQQIRYRVQDGDKKIFSPPFQPCKSKHPDPL